MGYWYYDCYIEADTLAEQKAQEAECRKKMTIEQVTIKESLKTEPTSFQPAKSKKWNDVYSKYLWSTSPIDLIPEERKDREFLIDAWKWNKAYDRKKRLEKERWEKEWAWAWGKSYVYFIFDPDRNLTKIGYSSELPNRFKRLQSEYLNIQLKGVIPGDYQDEQEWHKIFNNFRVEGEWFWFPFPLLNCIKHLTARPAKPLDAVRQPLATT